MHRTIFIILITLLLGSACSENRTAAQSAPFEPDRFLVESIQVATSNVELGRSASQRARKPETKQLGLELAAGQAKLRDVLLQIAKKKGVAPPAQLQERQLALRDNLSTLPGQVFDRGYSLAMTQELDTLAARFERAAASNDADFASLRAEVSQLRASQDRAQKVLDDLGGSPFHVQ